MKKILTVAAFLATLTTGAANAENFDFSYTFSTSDSLTPVYTSVDTITGSFTGTLDTSTTLISNISDIQVTFDGVAFTGPLIAVAWNATTSNFDDMIAPIVSTNAALNNFAFGDAGVAIGNPNQYLAFINDPNPDPPQRAGGRPAECLVRPGGVCRCADRHQIQPRRGPRHAQGQGS